MEAGPETTKLERASIDCESVGDADRYRTLAHLEEGLNTLPGAPKESGRVALIAREAGATGALFGDNLFLSLDLSTENLPPGSRLRVGGALLRVTPMPHNGCHKFQARFGPDALRFVSKAELRHRNLRDVYLRTVEGGEITPGDPVSVTERAPSPP